MVEGIFDQLALELEVLEFLPLESLTFKVRVSIHEAKLTHFDLLCVLNRDVTQDVISGFKLILVTPVLLAKEVISFIFRLFKTFITSVEPFFVLVPMVFHRGSYPLC